MKTEYVRCIQNESNITQTTAKTTQNFAVNNSTTKIFSNSEAPTKMNVTKVNATIPSTNTKTKSTTPKSTEVTSKSSEVSKVTESNTTCSRTSTLKPTNIVENSTMSINITPSTVSSKNSHPSPETKTTILISSTKTEQTQIPSTTNTTIASTDTNNNNITKSYSIITNNINATNNSSVSQGICNNYPKHCDRPSTWETTVKGETRDFFQILKARFGNKIKILRHTTHWPHNLNITLHNMRMNLIEDNESFHFGTHNEG